MKKKLNFLILSFILALGNNGVAFANTSPTDWQTGDYGTSFNNLNGDYINNMSPPTINNYPSVIAPNSVVRSYNGTNYIVESNPDGSKTFVLNGQRYVMDKNVVNSNGQVVFDYNNDLYYPENHLQYKDTGWDYRPYTCTSDGSDCRVNNSINSFNSNSQIATNSGTVLDQTSGFNSDHNTQKVLGGIQNIDMTEIYQLMNAAPQLQQLEANLAQKNTEYQSTYQQGIQAQAQLDAGNLSAFTGMSPNFVTNNNIVNNNSASDVNNRVDYHPIDNMDGIAYLNAGGAYRKDGSPFLYVKGSDAPLGIKINGKDYLVCGMVNSQKINSVYSDDSGLAYGGYATWRTEEVTVGSGNIAVASKELYEKTGEAICQRAQVKDVYNDGIRGIDGDIVY